MTAMAHSSARALAVGSVIAGTYTIEGLIGTGGMGEVFIASHARLPGKKVAIKVLHPDVADSEALARFRREAEIASRLGHPNIVEVHDWNQLPDGTPYIVLELLRGESLADRLRRGPMSLDEVALVVRQVGSALAAAHREHIVHRDLKPQNIFLVPTDDGMGVKAKVLDFGISKIRGSTTVKTQDSAMLGTPQYMSPEQATGRHDAVDGRTDVFALGAVVYEMLCGAPVFGGMTIPEVVFKVVYEEAPSLADRMPGLPPYVVAAVHRALEKKSADRWDDVGSFVEALTGAPLQTGRRGLVAAPGDGTPSGVATAALSPGGAGGPGGSLGGPRATGQDAFAATVGSGDHAGAMVADVRTSLAAAQTMAGVPGDRGAGESARGVMGSGGGGTLAGMGVMGDEGPADTVPIPGGRTEPGAGGKSRTGVIIAVTAVLAAGVAVAVVLAVGGGGGGAANTSSNSSSGSSSSSSSGSGSGSTGSGSGSAGNSGGGSAVAAGLGVDAGPNALAMADAAPAGVDGLEGGPAVAVDAGTAAPTDAGARPRVDVGTARAKPDAGVAADPDAGGDDDPTLRQGIAAGDRALASGDPDEALRIAKRLTNEHPKAQNAWALRARAACALGDREAASAALRRVSRPQVTRAVRRACKADGLDL